MDNKNTYTDITLPEVTYENYIEDKVEHDLFIPDYYPTAQKILHCEASVSILSKEMVEDKITLDGVCIWKILYRSEEDDALHQVTCEHPFTEYFSTPDVSGCIRYKIKTKNVSCKLHSSQRGECKAMLCIAVKVISNKKEKIICDTEDEEIEMLKEEVTLFESVDTYEKEFPITTEAEIKNRQECDVYKVASEILIRECKCTDDKIIIKGICKNRIILLEKGHCKADNIECESTFTQVIDALGVDEKCIACVQCCPLESDINRSAGNEEMILIDSNVHAQVSVYRPIQVSMCIDAYHPSAELSLERKEVEYYSGIRNMELTAHLTQRLPINTQNMSILFTEASGEIIKIGATENTLVIEGTISAGVAYSTVDEVNYSVFPMPLQTVRTMEEAFDRLKCEAELTINNFSYIILSDNELEISCDCKISLTVYTLADVNSITSITVAEAREQTLPAPLVIYYAAEGERIWDIGKKYSVPIQALIDNNELTEKVLSENKLILISKK